MVPGFNTDFKYRGETYHVQTEDNGLGNPVVVTLLYHKGAILASRRTPYNELIGKAEFEKELMGLMKNQHKELMRALLAGAYDKNGAAPAVAVPAAKPAVQALPELVATVTLRATPGAAEIPRQTIAPRSTLTTLDEAIQRFLEEFAATAAATN